MKDRVSNLLISVDEIGKERRKGSPIKGQPLDLGKVLFKKRLDPLGFCKGIYEYAIPCGVMEDFKNLQPGICINSIDYRWNIMRNQ
jgi:hypothetical protein